MTESNPKTTKRRTLPMQAKFMPGHRFFCRRIEIPAELESEEVEGFVSLELENLSPFPVEHLHFGYALDSHVQHAFVYAAYRRSFDRSSLADWDKVESALPDFAFALFSDVQHEDRLLILSEDSVTYLEYDESSNLPALFQSFPREGEDEEDIARVREELSERIGNNSVGIWRAGTDVQLDRQDVVLAAADLDDGHALTNIVNRSSLWQYDLRDADTVQKIKSDEKRNVLLWRMVLGVVALVALLFAGELGYGLSWGYLKLRESWNKEQQPIAFEVQDKARTIDELRKFQEADAKPFDMLIGIEQYRTDRITFSQVSTDGPNRLVIDAKSGNESEMNSFKRRLEGFDKVESVRIENPNTSQARVDFRAIVTFKPGAFFVPEESSTPTEVASNE